MSTEYKKLYRSRSHRMIGGVCGGLGDYFGIDPTLVRVLFVVGSILGWGVLILAYLILLIFVPEEPIETPVPPAGDDQAPS
jgi:phage shock protein C